MNNEAAIGYMIMAAGGFDLEEDIIRKIEGWMHYKMDIMTEEEAIKAYKSFLGRNLHDSK